MKYSILPIKIKSSGWNIDVYVPEIREENTLDKAKNYILNNPVRYSQQRIIVEEDDAGNFEIVAFESRKNNTVKK